VHLSLLFVVVYSYVYLVVLCNRSFYYYPFYLGFLFSAAFDFGIKRVIFYKFVDEQCWSQIKYSLWSTPQSSLYSFWLQTRYVFLLLMYPMTLPVCGFSSEWWMWYFSVFFYTFLGYQLLVNFSTLVWFTDVLVYLMSKVMWR